MRKRDLLSPLLFILVNEALNRVLHSLVDQGKIKIISDVCGSTPPSHVMYVDDMIIFCNASFSSVRNVVQLLDKYGVFMGIC